MSEKMFYLGKTVEELSKEELILALKQCHDLYLSAAASHQSTLRMWELCRELREQTS